jgi:hypothetical protein
MTGSSRICHEVLGAWLDGFPGAALQPQTAFVPGDPLLAAHAQRQFRELVADLLRDVEQLPLVGPVQPVTPEYLRLDGPDPIAPARAGPSRQTYTTLNVSPQGLSKDEPGALRQRAGHL